MSEATVCEMIDGLRPDKTYSELKAENEALRQRECALIAGEMKKMTRVDCQAHREWLLSLAGSDAVLGARVAELEQVLMEVHESSEYWSEYYVPVGLPERIAAALGLDCGGKVVESEPN